jgi:hypothetical protein
MKKEGKIKKRRRKERAVGGTEKSPQNRLSSGKEEFIYYAFLNILCF